MSSKILPWVLLPTALLAISVVLVNTNRVQAQAPPAPAAPASELAVLRAEIERLRGLVPSQSHAMADVGYHFANCWSAADRKNWALAQFFLDETRSHLRWAVRIIPVRKDPAGNPVKLEEILSSIEKTSLQQVADAIKAGDSAAFRPAYQQMLDSCYACHLASGKPYLRLHIPTQPAAPILNFDPQP